MACFHTCLNSVASAFKSTDLVYIHYVSKENFAVTVMGFTFTNKLCGKHMRTKNSSHPCGCCEFAGVRSPVLIRISSSCDIAVNSQDSVIFSGLLTEKSDLRSCCCVLLCAIAEVWGLFWNSKLILNQLEDILIMVKFMTLPLVPFYSVLTQVILQQMEWSNHCFGLSN